MQTVKKFIVPLMAIAFCLFFLLGCSSDDKDTTAPEQVEQERTLPLDQQPEEAGQPGAAGEVQTTTEEQMETGEEQEDAVPDVTVEDTETDTQEERRPTRPRRALEGC